MPQATFVLKQPKGGDETLIYLLYRFNGAKLKYSTGQKIHPIRWNPEKQRAKILRSSKEHESINLLLDDLEANVNNAYRDLILHRVTPTPERLRKSLNQILQKETAPSKDLPEFADSVLTASDRKESTKKAIRQTIRNLKEFKVKTGKSLHFDAIDLDFYNDYLEYAKNQGYGQNTIGTHVKNIKVFMREAFERGLTKNMHFRSKRFRKMQEESQSIYLTDQELQKIYDLDFLGCSRLDKVRDLFLVGCYTGLRFSDLISLRIENINHCQKIIKVKTQKTGEMVVIPINSIVSKIIDKYDGNLPTAISNVKMNTYLKEIAEKADLAQSIEVVFTKGGERTREIYKKHEMVTVHTARRSFATNAYLAQVPTISIMKITGHRTERSFLQYIKISQEDNANKLVNHPFFK